MSKNNEDQKKKNLPQNPLQNAPLAPAVHPSNLFRKLLFCLMIVKDLNLF